MFDDQVGEVEQDIGNLTIFSDQLRKVLDSASENETHNFGWHKVSPIFDSGFCDTVADPMGFSLL